MVTVNMNKKVLIFLICMPNMQLFQYMFLLLLNAFTFFFTFFVIRIFLFKELGNQLL